MFKKLLLATFGFIVAFISILNLTVSNATSLNIQAINNLQNRLATACASTTIAATVNSTNYLTLNNLNPSCYNLPLVAQVVKTGSTTTQSLSGTATSSSLTLSSSAVSSPSTVVKVAVTVSGWNIPTTWAYSTPPSNTPITQNPTTPGITVNTTWVQLAPSQFCATITVSTTSTTQLLWKADLNITNMPFNNDTNASHYNFQQNYYYGLESNTAVNGKFTVIGLQPSSKYVTILTPQIIQVCNYNVPNPTGPSTTPGITYTQTETTPIPSYYVCKTITVSVTGSPQFYVGWEANVDISNLKNNKIGGGGVLQGPFGGFSATQTGPNTYKITGTGYLTSGVKDLQPVSFNMCWG